MSFQFRGKELPTHLEESLVAYVEDGRPTGGFLEAVICNDLNLAVARADDTNLPLISVIAGWLYNEAPSLCWGKPDSFDKWIQAKYLEREKAGAL